MDSIVKLKDFRSRMKMSQREFANLLEISHVHYHYLETGRSQPNAKQILKFCEILKCTPNDLFGFKGVHTVLMDELDSK